MGEVVVETGEAGGLEEIVLFDRLVITRYQGSFFYNAFRTLKLPAEPQGHAHLAGHQLKGSQLFLFLIVIPLELMVLATKRFDLTTERVVIGYFPGHPEVT